MLDDYAFLTHACLDGWIATGSAKYYRAALDLAERMIAEFYDPVGGGFFDAKAKGPELLGALTARRKPLQDSPVPAGNPAAAGALLRLEALNGRADLREKAEDTLEAFAGVVTHFGLYAGTYGLALERFLLPPVQVVVIGEDAAADELEAAAIMGYAVNKSVIRLTRAQVGQELPPLLAETLPLLPGPQSGAQLRRSVPGNLLPSADGQPGTAAGFAAGLVGAGVHPAVGSGNLDNERTLLLTKCHIVNRKEVSLPQKPNAVSVHCLSKSSIGGE